MTIKLDQLMPQNETWSFKDSQGKEHEFKMFVPFALSVKQAEYADRKNKKTGESYQLEALEILLKPQHPFMTAEWIAENISLNHQNYIYAGMINKVNEGAEAILKQQEIKGKKKILS